MLAPLTPQQGGHGCQHSSSDSSTDGGLASNGSMSSCGSGTPGPPLLCHPQQAMQHPFYWQPASPHGPRGPPPSPMAFPYMGTPAGPLAHGVMQHHPMQQGYMPAHGGMPPQSPLPHGMQSPLMTPQRPGAQGAMAHGLPPLAMPLTPQFHCMQPPSPAYMWQPGTPCQWQEAGEQFAYALPMLNIAAALALSTAQRWRCARDAHCSTVLLCFTTMIRSLVYS